jgi:hypothetical protein
MKASPCPQGAASRGRTAPSSSQRASPIAQCVDFRDERSTSCTHEGARWPQEAAPGDHGAPAPTSQAAFVALRSTLSRHEADRCDPRDNFVEHKASLSRKEVTPHEYDAEIPRRSTASRTLAGAKHRIREESWRDRVAVPGAERSHRDRRTARRSVGGRGAAADTKDSGLASAQGHSAGEAHQ